MKNINYNELKVPQLAGVYKIENKLTNKVYIGESINIGNRIAYHIDRLINHNHDNINMQKDYDEYGLADFKFSILQLIHQDKINKDDLVNYLLYMESAYYRKFEKDYDWYNIIIPYQAIEEHNVNIPFYNIDFEKVKELLDSDPYNIGYEKISWTNILSIDATLEEILNQKSDCDADKFYNALHDDMYNILLSFMLTQKYRICFCSNKRNLLCILNELGKINILKREKNFKQIHTNESNGYLYQDSKYIIKDNFDCQKPMVLSYQAQKDIVDYLKECNDDILKEIDNSFINFQRNQIEQTKNKHKIRLYSEDNIVPYDIEIMFN